MFSGKNWADFFKEVVNPRTGKHEMVKVKRATLFKAAMDRMKDEQWDDIVQAALATRPKNLKGIKSEEVEVVEGFDDVESDDDELLDPRYM